MALFGAADGRRQRDEISVRIARMSLIASSIQSFGWHASSGCKRHSLVMAEAGLFIGWGRALVGGGAESITWTALID